MTTRLIVQHHVTDYDEWFTVFNEGEAVRRRHGATGHAVNRSVDDPNLIVVVTDFASVEGARAFRHDPEMAAAMQRAGVDQAPQTWLVEEAHTRRY